MKTIYFFLIFLIFSLITQILTKEKPKHKSSSTKGKGKRKKSDNLMENGLPTPDSIRPSHVSPELLCDSCQAIISEAVKRLGKQTKSSEVLFYLDKVCENVDFNNIKAMDDTIMVDGEPVKIDELNKKNKKKKKKKKEKTDEL